MRRFFVSEGSIEDEVVRWLEYNEEPSKRVSQVYLYHVFASKYGWTPDEVDRQRYWVIRGLLAILKVESMKGEVTGVEFERFIDGVV